MEKKTLGAFIAQLRKEKGLTQKSLAELLSVSDKTVSHWECDETSPDISLLPLLAEALGVTVDELLKGEKKPAQPSVEHHYLPPKEEGLTDKASALATKILDKIKGKMTGDIAERYSYFRILSLIGTVIAAVVIISITVTNLISCYFMASDMGFVSGLVAFISSLWTLVISLGFTLGARIAFYKSMLPSAEATDTERKYIYKANSFCFNNIFLVFCSLPMALTGIDALYISVVLNIPLAVLLLAVMWLVLLVTLNKKGILCTDKKKLLRIRYLSIFALSAVIITASSAFFAEAFCHPRAEEIAFYSAEEFIAYMETPKEKPANSDIIDGVSATILFYDGVMIEDDSDYVHTEAFVFGGQHYSFKWLNKDVYSYDEADDCIYVTTYEAKLEQKDKEILVDDGVPIVIVMFLVVDAVTCLCLYKRKLKALTEG